MKPDSKVIKVKVIDASPTGLTIEKARLIKDGLKIIETKRKRNKISRRELITEELSTSEEVFYLKKLANKQKITSGPDYKVFNVTVKPALLGSYKLEATIDGKDVAYTNIYTKPDFRIDSINPQVVNFGSEVTFAITGKGLNSFTNVVFSGDGITIKDFECLNDNLIKVKAFIGSASKPGFRDVGISNTLAGSTSVLTFGLYVGPVDGKDGEDGKDGLDGKDGIQGEIGPQGTAGLDGMGICNNATDSLMIFANNRPPGSQADVFLDPVLCNLTLGIPVGFNGYNGSNGSDGMTGATGATGLSSLIKVTNEPEGSNCNDGGIKVQTGIDSNSNNVLDTSEVATINYVCGDD